MRTDSHSASAALSGSDRSHESQHRRTSFSDSPSVGLGGLSFGGLTKTVFPFSARERRRAGWAAAGLQQRSSHDKAREAR